MNTLHANGLSKRYGRKTVLDGLDLVLEPGAVTVLLGRNGAGKSTFMKLALGVLRPDAGTIRVAGLDPARRARDVRRAVGYVPYSDGGAHEIPNAPAPRGFSGLQASPSSPDGGVERALVAGVRCPRGPLSGPPRSIS
jgi:ABC-2 type transport system ATP-binding protein